jgi:hypothetical protein
MPYSFEALLYLSKRNNKMKPTGIAEVPWLVLCLDVEAEAFVSGVCTCCGTSSFGMYMTSARKAVPTSGVFENLRPVTLLLGPDL